MAKDLTKALAKHMTSKSAVEETSKKRASSPELDEDKRNYDLSGRMERDGVKFKKSDRYWLADKCPICGHNDCLRYYPKSNTYNCFSSAHDHGGSAIDYLQDSGYSYLDALREVSPRSVRADKVCESLKTNPQKPAAIEPSKANTLARADDKKKLSTEELTKSLMALVGNSIGFDTMCCLPFVHGVLPWSGIAEMRPFNDRDYAELRLCTEQHVPGKFTKDGFDTALNVVFNRTSFDPLKDEVANLPEWDGVPRIGTLMVRYLGAQDDDYGHEVESLIFRAGVRRIYEPGAKFDYMIVLSGAQGIGKSTFCQRLAIDKSFYSDGVDFRSLHAKDTAEIVAGAQVIELAELAGMKGSDVETIKSWVTRTFDEFRAPYGRYKERHYRRCIVVGTTNEENFLTDRTGNRRFLCVRTGVNTPTANLFGEDAEREFEQAWAEAVKRWSGDTAPLVMPKHLSAAVNDSQSGATMDDPKIGLIDVYLNDTISQSTCPCVCVPELIRNALERDEKDAQEKYLVREVHTIMQNEFPDWVKNPTRKTLHPWGKQYVYEYRGQ